MAAAAHAATSRYSVGGRAGLPRRLSNTSPTNELPQEDDILPLRVSRDLLLEVLGELGDHARTSSGLSSARTSRSSGTDSMGALSSRLDRGGFGAGSKSFLQCSSRAREVCQNSAITADGMLVRRVDVEETVREGVSRARGCLVMFLTLGLLTSFTGWTAVREDVSRGFLLQHPLADRLSQGLGEVHAVPEVWEWIESVYVPTFFEQHNMYGEQLPASEWSRVLQYGQMRGAVAMKQARSVRQPCEDPLARNLFCHPLRHPSAEPFGRAVVEVPLDLNARYFSGPDEGFVVSRGSSRRLRPRREELQRFLPGAVSDELAFRFLLHRLSPREVIRHRLEYLRARRWLDEQSTRLELKAHVLNMESDSPKLIAVTVSFDFSRGGGVFTGLRFEEVPLRAFGYFPNLAANAYFVAWLVIFSVFMLNQLCASGRSAGATNILTGIGVVFMWLHQVGNVFVLNPMCKHVISSLEKVSEAEGSPGLPGGVPGAAGEDAALEYHKAADELELFSSWFHTATTYMVLLLMVRAFMTLEFQPRLALVVKTLKVSAIDLTQFAVIILPTFVAYAIAGMCLFGRRVDVFASFERALGTCFKIAIESEFDWNELSAEDPITTASWVWSYILLLVMLILNMVLAIVMDVYSEIRHSTHQREPIWDSFRFIFNRARWWRRWVPGEAVLECVQCLPSVLTTAELWRAFQTSLPEMGEWQLEYILSGARFKLSCLKFSTAQEEEFRVQLVAAMSVMSNQAFQTMERLLAATAVPTARGRSEKPSGVHGSTCMSTTGSTCTDAEGMETMPSLQSLEALQKQRKAPPRSDAVCQEDILQSIAVQNHWIMTVQEQLERIRALQRADANAARNSQAPSCHRPATDLPTA